MRVCVLEVELLHHVAKASWWCFAWFVGVYEKDYVEVLIDPVLELVL